MIDVRVATAAALQTPVLDIEPLSGGCIGRVFRLTLTDGRTVVVKAATGQPTSSMPSEAYMLDYLRQHSLLPVPKVYYVDDDILVMSFISGDSSLDTEAEQDAAAHLARLHAITAEAYGFERDTLIGGLPQPNPWTRHWIPFFGRHRLVYMAEEALRAGRLPLDDALRVGRLAEHLDRWLTEPEAPSLIHGDVWTTNILARSGRITGFLDPAIYFADPEIELAFTTLFGTFGEPFFRHYNELRPIRPGFFEERRELYNLYPLLVHVRLFGGAYLGSVRQTLARFGY